MNQRDMFKNSLIEYYKYLLKRFENGSNYLDQHDCKENSKEYIAYQNIINELSHIETLLNFYKK